MFNLFNKMKIIDDSDIVAMVDSTMFNIEEVHDEVFANKIMGTGVAFKVKNKVANICSPANGTLCMLFNTGHAFGIKMNDGTELLVHIGIDTVMANGKGFKIKNKKQGDIIKAGENIVEVDYELLSEEYDMDTLLIITNPKHEIAFNEVGEYKKGQSILKKTK